MRQVARKGLITMAAAGGVLAAAAGYAHADAGAGGSAANSPGIASGNNVQAPVDVPVNVCGNTVNVVGVLNPTFGNDCANGGGGKHGHHQGGGHGHG
ncbi:chaplin, partial [Streptomyces sp. NPDC059008]